MAGKIFATVAIAAAQFSLTSATACGWLGEACCNIQPNNPNIGHCEDPRSVCWEGICMGCGTNGKIACPTHPKCEEGNILNREGWCTQDPNAPVVHTCDRPCGHGKVCFYGNCEDCGNNGQPVCDEGSVCKDGLVPNKDGFCTVDVTCGFANTDCCANHFCHDDATCEGGKCVAAPPTCDGGCRHGEVCFWGECKHCGASGQPMCDEGDKCDRGLVVNEDGFCTQGPHCGWLNEECCEHDRCYDDNTVCNNGMCVPPPPPCGSQGEQCCEHNVCTEDSTICEDGQCVLPPPPPTNCGWKGEACCEHDVCLARNTSCRRGVCRRNRW